MRGNKRLVQGIAVAGATGVLVCTVNFSQPQIMQTEGTAVQITANATAGVMAALDPDDQIGRLLAQKVSVEKNNVYNVTASKASEKTAAQLPPVVEELQPVKKAQAAESAKPQKEAQAVEDSKLIKETQQAADAKQAEDSQQTEDSKLSENAQQTDDLQGAVIEENKAAEKAVEVTAEKSEVEKQSASEGKWDNKLMADVDKSLNIRESADEESEVIGKLRKGDLAKVLKRGKTWTKIKSGSVTGYVKNDYCVYGTKAYKLAKKVCETYATVQADGLRIRSKANENAAILDAAEEGDKLVVNTKAKKKDGWVAVKLGDTKGYVSAEYVDVALGTGRAITIEEEQAQIAAAQAAAAREAAAQETSSGSTAAVSNQSVQASSDDLTLLSAIIYCEAGGESYEGQVAVGAVVMNRVRSGSYPNSISSVIYQSGQFSPVANGALSRALSNGSYRHCVSAAQAALAGTDNTGGAKYFHRANGAAGLVIGHHVFY